MAEEEAPKAWSFADQNKDEQAVALAALLSLKTLSLVDNKVTKVENYRAFVISLLPNLKILDFQKIKPREREEVEAAYGSAAKRPRLGSAAPAGSAGASSTLPLAGRPSACRTSRARARPRVLNTRLSQAACLPTCWPSATTSRSDHRSSPPRVWPTRTSPIRQR